MSEQQPPERASGVIRPTIDPNATHCLYEACCRRCDAISYPGVLSEIETWLAAHLRSKHSVEISERRAIPLGEEDWPMEVKQ